MGDSDLTPRQARSLIEHLIVWLDLVEPDPDLEDGGDAEPSLGFPDGSPGEGAMVLGMGGRFGAYVDAELDASDREPWLGWTIDGVLGGHRDLEEQHDLEDVNA
ncbi:hypothetical protein [Bradyrhizobium sp. CIR3A]|uniref:hypothetical protein n=1 Tax=Bradyrhizobium sp. CIR3A TaxID=2663838 RepID=UPI00160571C0|nr:hypothetical protein [Bradyrhizobium sp. CIR3A]MBB4262673.1 hypothetical protein [Bradyrhizobium sp. CIR3A]